MNQEWRYLNEDEKPANVRPEMDSLWNRAQVRCINGNWFARIDELGNFWKNNQDDSPSGAVRKAIVSRVYGR